MQQVVEEAEAAAPAPGRDGDGGSAGPGEGSLIERQLARLACATTPHASNCSRMACAVHHPGPDGQGARAVRGPAMRPPDRSLGEACGREGAGRWSVIFFSREKR